MAQVTITKFGILSVAKVQAVLMAIFGLIIGIMYGLIFMIMGASMLSAAGRSGTGAAGGSVVIGLVMMIAIPIFYGVIGFISGIIGALVYNLVAGIAGGIQMEIEGDSIGLLNPPNPPQQWGDPNQQYKYQQ